MLKVGSLQYGSHFLGQSILIWFRFVAKVWGGAMLAWASTNGLATGRYPTMHWNDSNDIIMQGIFQKFSAGQEPAAGRSGTDAAAPSHPAATVCGFRTEARRDMLRARALAARD